MRRKPEMIGVCDLVLIGLKTILAYHSGRPEEQVKNDSDRDYYMSAADAKNRRSGRSGRGVAQGTQARKQAGTDFRRDSSHAGPCRDQSPRPDHTGPRR